MPSTSQTPRVIGLAAALVLVLAPPPAPVPQRDRARDATALRQAECEYRGITGTFEEVTRAYVLAAYEGGELVRWEARPSPQNPASESLVTAVYRVTGVQEPDAATPRSVVARRRRARHGLGITWRYSTLAAVQITAANDYAVDAIAVYRRTVDAFIARMVVVAAGTELHVQPDAAAGTADTLAAGTVLLRETFPEGMVPSPGWEYVRIPSTTTTGWVADRELIAVEND